MSHASLERLERTNFWRCAIKKKKKARESPLLTIMWFLHKADATISGRQQSEIYILLFIRGSWISDLMARRQSGNEWLLHA